MLPENLFNQTFQRKLLASLTVIAINPCIKSISVNPHDAGTNFSGSETWLIGFITLASYEMNFQVVFIFLFLHDYLNLN
jgi:hypothetical protein